MLMQVIIASAILVLAIGYIILRRMTTTRQEIAFSAPQDGVERIFVDIREDTIRGLHIQFVDGSIAEVAISGAGYCYPGS